VQIHSVGIDLGKTTFHLVALGAAGKVLVRKKFTRNQLLAYTANMPASLIGLEACAGAHFLGRALRKQRHDVRLIAGQFVKPFVKSNKNDFIDAEAIAEAVERENMRFVPIKTDDQLDLQGIHRVYASRKAYGYFASNNSTEKRKRQSVVLQAFALPFN
jgi:transposase